MLEIVESVMTPDGVVELFPEPLDAVHSGM
jgi:hypothetical protein